MRLPRRQFLQLATGAATLSTAPRVVRAQAYPTQTIMIILPFAPGGRRQDYERGRGHAIS
jgi:tripartite-type tricarboxylate transporter receptor subunit TctC